MSDHSRTAGNRELKQLCRANTGRNIRVSIRLAPSALFLDSVNEGPTGTEPDTKWRGGEALETFEKWRESRIIN